MKKWVENGYEYIDYENGTDEKPSTILKTSICEEVLPIATPKPLTLEEINSKLDDITLLMLTQGGIIA